MTNRTAADDEFDAYLANLDIKPGELDNTEGDCVTCIYCMADVTENSPAEVDDEEGWRQRATEHAADCEWIATRAHRLPETRDTGHAREDEESRTTQDTPPQ